MGTKKEDKLCFTWTGHEVNIVSVIQTLYDMERFFDCTLMAAGQSFDVHRLVLSSCSPYFNDILRNHPSEHPVITLAGVSHVELRALVEYMYTGETSVPPLDLVNFIRIAKTLQIAGLSHYTDGELHEMLTDEDSTLEADESKIFDCYDGNPIVLNYLEQSMVSTEAGDFANISVEQTHSINNDFITLSGIHLTDGVDIKQEIEEDDYEEEFLEEVNRDALVSQSSEVDDEGNSIESEQEDTAIEELDDDYYEQNEIEDDSDQQYFDKSGMEFVNQEPTMAVKTESMKVIPNESGLKHKRDPTIWKLRNVVLKNCLMPSKPSNVSSGNLLMKQIKLRPASGSNLSDKKIYMCVKCGNKYSHRRTLLHHMHWICDQPATYSCNLCPYMGKRKFQLKSHMKHVHLLKLI